MVSLNQWTLLSKLVGVLYDFQLHLYQNTFICKYHLTIVFDSVRRNMTMCWNYLVVLGAIFNFAPFVGKFILMSYSFKDMTYIDTSFLYRLRSIAAPRDHFVRRLSVCLSVRASVCLSGSHTFLVVTHSYVFTGDTCIHRKAATMF